MPRLPDQPELHWNDDQTPVATGFDDVYYSVANGLEETRSVFLKACGLPERWQNRSVFTIAELGFGTGLNFLATIDLWRKSQRHDAGWLHFLTVEKFPLSQKDAERSLSNWPELPTETLIERWPVRTRGAQRIVFPEWKASLTLYIGDAEDWLNTCDFQADAWFLDGFSPAKNDAMWSDAVLEQVAQHSAPGCRVGTFTVAGHVRRGLAAAGFEVSKQPGYGRKRERLEAVMGPVSRPTEPDIYLTSPEETAFDKVEIIGAGIAGASLARVFAERGFPVQVTDTSDTPASGASGNPLALVMPRLDVGDTSQARLLIQSYFHALQFYRSRAPSACEDVTIEQFAQSDAETLRFEKLLEDPPLDEDWLTGLSDKRGLRHSGALILRPPELVRTLLDHERITRCMGHTVSPDDLAEADTLDGVLRIVASGRLSAALLPGAHLPLAGKLGQVEYGETTDKVEPAARAGGNYVLRLGDELVCGATFEAIPDDREPEISDAARNHNLHALTGLSPDWADCLDLESLRSRASVRATTPDRLPIAGVAFQSECAGKILAPISKGAEVAEHVPHQNGVYVLSGLGARGFTFAPLMADLILSMARGEALPFARPEAEAVSPIRFLVRAIRKGQIEV
ncbi:MAG: hypothetical protein CMK09_01730 [Ponticaulis sp.]|nr:hypothetical protein [Ponticaulis sp.]|tara:strand:- start:24425 stop:26302 length:1878 start_codon:yes stop_codon:yes gene_type:complete